MIKFFLAGLLLIMIDVAAAVVLKLNGIGIGDDTNFGVCMLFAVGVGCLIFSGCLERKRGNL